MHINYDIDTNALTSHIEKHVYRRRTPYIVSIDGRSGVGKTTFASVLGGRLDATILEGDDFFAGGIDISTDDARTLADKCIDRGAQSVVLKRLRANKSATYFPFDWVAFDGTLSSLQVTIEPSPVIIFEGVYSSHPQLSELVDYRVLLTTTEKERMWRIKLRENEITDWERQWHRAEEWYFENLATNISFDRVLET